MGQSVTGFYQSFKQSCWRRGKIGKLLMNVRFQEAKIKDLVEVQKKQTSTPKNGTGFQMPPTNRPPVAPYRECGATEHKAHNCSKRGLHRRLN